MENEKYAKNGAKIMNKTFENPEITVSVLNVEDIIAASGTPSAPSTGEGGLPIIPG